jgi:hypothetical protein
MIWIRRLAFAAILSAPNLHDVSADPACNPPAKAMARTELLFGAARVSDVQWKHFLAREVTPRFPDGLTALNGYGQWQAPNGTIVKERSRILLLWRSEDAAANAKVEAIRAAYKRQFHQQSVMRVDSENCVSF